MKLVRLIILLIIATSVTACHPFGESNLETPSPLVKFTPTAHVQQLWSTRVGNGSDDLNLRFALGYANNTIYSTSASGDVVATNATTGKNHWENNLDVNVTSGVSVGNGLVVVGTDTGHAIALDTKTGKKVWNVNIGNQMLAPAQIKKGVVIVKTVADALVAVDAKSGRQLWNFVIGAPTLILRFGSTPQIADSTVYAGFANGRLVAINLQLGTIRWQQQIAIPTGANDVQQMVDIDAAPVLHSQRVYVATYQGYIAALDLSRGQLIWSHKISSYTGLVAHGNAIYITDAKGQVWSFAGSNGRVMWRQKKLQARLLSAPSVIGDMIVVGDGEGYLHWINQQTGQFVARVDVSDGDAIASKPLVVGDAVYVLTNGGELAAYQLGKVVHGH